MTESHFGLKIPEQHPGSQDDSDIRPKKVGAWIKSLPMADTVVAAQQLCLFLIKINRRTISPQNRFKLMEQLREPIYYCTTALKDSFAGQSFPLSQKNQRLAEKSFSLLSEATNGYKIAIVDLLSKDRVDKKILAYCVHRTLRLLGNILLTSYQLYTSEPEDTWKEIHRLFFLAESGEILNTAIKDPENRLSKLNSINKTYKQITLLSLSNPYHLRNGEIENLHSALDQWGQYSEIFSSSTIPKEHNLFVCRLNTDHPPGNLDTISPEENKYNRYINLTHLIAVLRKEISQRLKNKDTSKQEKTGASLSPLENDLLRRLLLAWNSRSKRKFSRFSSQKPVSISVGLNNTHYLLGRDLSIGSENNKPESLSTIQKNRSSDPNANLSTQFSIKTVPEDFEPEVAFLQSNASVIINNMNHLVEATEATSIPEPKYQAQTWQILNVSAGGYCLLWDNDKSSNVHVGEMIGIRELSEENSGVWGIGVVRWMQYIQDKGLKLGIQILSTNAEAFLSHAIQPGHKYSGKAYNCLGLPELKSTKQSLSLLTPARHYKVGDALIINNQGNNFRVQLTHLLENTGNYSHFQYIPLDTQESTQDTALGKNYYRHQGKKAPK